MKPRPWDDIERLTQKSDGGDTKYITRPDLARVAYEKCVDRLGEYENSGYTPEDVAGLIARMQEFGTQAAGIWNGLLGGRYRCGN